MDPGSGGTFWMRSSHASLERVELDLKQIEAFNDERGRQCPPQLAMNNTEARSFTSSREDGCRSRTLSSVILLT
jgi:hypothetical protein